MSWRRRSKYGVKLSTADVNQLADAIATQTHLNKKEARKVALQQVYPKRTFEGQLFASEWECTRWQQLLEAQARGEIRDLVCHKPVFKLEVNGQVIATYTPDSSYTVVETGLHVIEDAKSKSTQTDIFERNKKHIKAQYGVDITLAMAPETPRRGRRK